MEGRDKLPITEHAELEIYRSVFRTSPDLISLCRVDGTYIDVNPSFEGFVGLPRARIVGRTATEVGVWPNAAQRTAFMDEVKTKGELLGRRTLLVNFTGDPRDVEVSASMFDAGNERILVEIGRYVTERRGDEDEASPHRLSVTEHDELEIYRRIFRASPDFISFCRMDDVYIDVNPGFEHFVGLPRSQIVGRTALDIGLWPNAQQRDAFVDELQMKGELLGYRKLLMKFGGDARDIEGWASIVDIGNEKILVAIGRDITERTREQDELKLYRDHLEQLVERRTVELSESNQRLQEANNAKSTFLANMSHELRTPLHAVLGYAQLMKREKHLSEQQLVGLNTIQQSGEHLLSMISHLLDLSKIEAGKLELFLSAVDLAGFLPVIVDIVRIKAEQKGLEFRYEPPAPMPGAVMIDESRMRQVLLNLLGNAIKFTDVGEVALRVTSTPQRTGQTSLHFEVSDTGVGIDPSQFETIFQPFEQGGDQRHRVGGTGLGLSISRQLVRMMGGDIHVGSQPGKGSRFSFELKVAVVDSVESRRPTKGRLVGYEGAPKKVLIVDDVATNRALLTDLLHEFGFSIVQAVDGEQAVQEAASALPDLILMDIMMPGMNGLEATRRIRSNPQLKSIPIIAVSASPSHEDERVILAAGANAFIAKPIDQDHLLQQVGQCLGFTWEVEQDSDHASPMAAAGTTMDVPEGEELERLYGLARAGNMGDIRRHAEHLRTLGTQYQPFADKLKHLADNYQSKAILALVEKYVKAGRPSNG